MGVVKAGVLLVAAPVVGWCVCAVLFMGYLAWVNEQAETGWDRERE